MESAASSSWAAGVPSMSTEPVGEGRVLRVRVLLSFERPTRESPGSRPLPDLENCIVGQTNQQMAKSPGPGDLRVAGVDDHRQDMKGTWWMPWHQESKKGVDGCDKPR
jgi:hypothetical protein